MKPDIPTAVVVTTLTLTGSRELSREIFGDIRANWCWPGGFNDRRNITPSASSRAKHSEGGLTAES